MSSDRTSDAPDFSIGFVDLSYINTFLNLILTGKPISAKDVFLWLDRKGYKSSRAENTLKLLEYANVVMQKDGHYLVTNPFLEETKKKNSEDALKQFIMMSIPKNELEMFTKTAYTSYPEPLIWKPDSMSPFLAQLRDFLMSLQLVNYEQGFIKASDVFIDYLLERSIIGIPQSVNNKSISKEELLFALEIKDRLGQLAERLAFEFEYARTAVFGKRPSLISNDNVAAGYDIESYESAQSTHFDRHIEVKYFNKNHFYISKNEIETAKMLSETYWLYLVTIKSDEDYSVEMINDPYSSVFNSSDWTSEHTILEFKKLP